MSSALAALTFAVAGALGYGLASVLQAVAARRSEGTLSTLRDPAYAAGLVLDLLAWVASLAALRALPVFEVQAVLAGSLAITAVGARVFLGARLGRREVIAVALAVVFLATLVIAAEPAGTTQLGGLATLALGASCVPLALIAFWAERAGRASLGAALAGLAFGGAALCARSIEAPQGHGSWQSGLLGMAAQPLALPLLAFGVTGMLLYAFALEHGEPGPVTAILWIVEVIAPALAGVALLGDRARPGWTPIAVLSLVGALVCAVLLANAQPNGGAAPRGTPGNGPPSGHE